MLSSCVDAQLADLHCFTNMDVCSICNMQDNKSVIHQSTIKVQLINHSDVYAVPKQVALVCHVIQECCVLHLLLFVIPEDA